MWTVIAALVGLAGKVIGIIWPGKSDKPTPAEATVQTKEASDAEERRHLGDSDDAARKRLREQRDALFGGDPGAGRGA